jgi:hypothetical protein
MGIGQRRWEARVSGDGRSDKNSRPSEVSHGLLIARADEEESDVTIAIVIDDEAGC